MLWFHKLAASTIAILMSTGALADDGHQNHFASVLLEGKKIGHVHYTTKHNEQGELEELRTKASLSVLGIKFYDFTQRLHEQWSGGELQTMWGRTNDDGVIDETTLKRTPTEYDASINDKPLKLPHEAFPISLWHHAITSRTLLFNLGDLRLMKVRISEHKDTVARSGKTIRTSRFDFVGGWNGSVWFDQNKQFVKAEYFSDKRLITIVMDP